MRSRNIKPGFFLNEKLAECDFKTRLLFIGLWCYADREGRFEWIPKRIEAAIFPYDKNVNVDKCLCNLMSLHLITSSTHGDNKIGYIENFKKHQKPHPHEAQSVLPSKLDVSACEQTLPLHVMTCNDMVGQCRSDVRKEDVRKEDVRIPQTASIDIALPSIISQESWDKWLEHRKKQKKPVTHYAKELAIAKLTRLHKEGHNPKDVITNSIENNYQGLFPVFKKQAQEPATSATCGLCGNILRDRETRYEHEGKIICGKCDMQKTREKLKITDNK